MNTEDSVGRNILCFGLKMFVIMEILKWEIRELAPKIIQLVYSECRRALFMSWS